MSITYFDFTPVKNANYQFSPTLDGEVYTAIVTWNWAAQRYYLNIYAINRTLIVSRAMIGSPVGVNLSSLSWAKGNAIGATITRHGFRVGSNFRATIAGCSPDAFNGAAQCYATSPTQFTYPLAANPGMATVLGNLNQNLNLVGGYFASTLVYRQANAQFEVSP